MEERIRSGSHSGGLVKNRSSSGCLIIKQKPDGVGGLGSSSSGGGRKLHESKKEKKRPRLTGSESVSSDEELLEFYRRRGVGVPGGNQAAHEPVVYRRGVGNHGEFSSRISDFDGIGFGRNELMREAGNRSKLDVYDFDEYDDLSEVDRIGMRHFFEREMGGGENMFLSPRPGLKSAVEFESESSKGDIIYRRRNSFNGSTSGEKIKGGDNRSVKRRYEVKKEHPISMGKEKMGGSNEAIRLQGKNGVLKVMVKHKENTAQLKLQNYMPVEGIPVSRSQEIMSKSVGMRSSPYSERNLQKKPVAISRIEKDRLRKRKSLSVKSSEESDEESEDSDTSRKLRSDSVGVHRPVKRGRGGGSMQSPERAQPTKLKEGKVKRGSGTEKQLLREKIRTMLVSAGWTIDYRPRRGRDYFDAVYVNPAGTAYWSIIKAYDALQKQLEEEGNSLKPGDDCSSFAPISDNVLSKLTRQTRKKIEKELKRKKREEGGGKRKKELTRRNFEEDDSDTDSTGSGRHDEKLSSFIKRNGKSLKGASKDTYSREGSSPSTKMQGRGENSSSMSNSRFIHGRESKKIGRCTLLVRSSEKGMDSDSDGFVHYKGKRNLLSWLIDSGTVKLSEKVHYMNRRRTRVMLEGWITRDGIHCGCCSKILTISKFEIHAASKLRQPFQNIYLSSGLSLLECQVDAWNRQDESQRNGFCEIDVDGDDPNDDTCAICGDGGNLICCDGCPSTFHQKCLDIRMLPPGDWHCPHCSCKFCSLADVSMMEGNNTRKDILLTCSLCEAKYHSSCMEEMVDIPVNSNSSFCGNKCQELFEHLQKLLGVKYELEAGLCWSLIHRTDLDSDTSCRGYPQRVEWNSKLAVALTLMDECFLPIIDRRSGINVIHNVLYNCGSNFTRLNYSGFYTAILERGDEIVSAASIRIRGTQFAEMPYIGTRHIYRRQGMCRRLFSAIESALRSLKVEKLIIPAISELMDTWTRVFGFGALGDKDKQEMKTLNMLAFPGTDMLLKKLSDQDSMKSFSGVDSLEVAHNPLTVPDLSNKGDLDASPEPSSAAAVLDNKRIDDKSDTAFCSRGAVTSAVETSPHSNSEDVSDEVKPLLHSASADMSDEVKLLVSSVGDQGTVSTNLQLDTKFTESAVGLKVHTFPDSSADFHEIGSFLNNSPAEHDMEASADCKLMEVATEADVVAELPTVDISITSTPDALNGFENDKHGLTAGTLCSENGSVADKEQHSFTETTHGDVIVEKPMIAAHAEGNNRDSTEVEVGGASVADKEHHSLTETTHEDVIVEKPIAACAEGKHNQDSTEVDVDGTCEVPANVESVCFSSQKKEIMPTSADGMHRSPSHGGVGKEKPLPDSCNEDSNQQNLEGELHDAHGISVRVSSIQSVSNFSCEISVQNVRIVGVEKPQRESCDVGGTKAILKGEANQAHDIPIEVVGVEPVRNTCEVSAQNIGTAGEEKNQLDSCAGGDNQPNSEAEVHHPRDVVEVASVQPVANFSCKISAQHDGAVEQEKPKLDSCGEGNQEISTHNEGAVGQELPQLDSCADSNQAVLDSEVQPAHDISAVVASAQPVSNFEASAHSSATLPTSSTDGGTGQALLSVSDLDAI